MKKLVFITAILFLSTVTNAQNRHEFGLYLGGSYYIGDMNTSSHFMKTSPGGGLIYRYIFNDRWALRVNGLYGMLKGDDADNPNEDLEGRNLHFRSTIFEFSAIAELNFLPFRAGGTRDLFTPYIFGGLGVFHFDPEAEFDGEWYKLQPLGTEGQGTTAYPDRPYYSLTTVSVPFGIGVKWSIGRSVILGAEWGLRKTFTDYIDDVSATYADPFILMSENTPAALIFGNRMLEEIALSTLDISPKTGQSNLEDLETYGSLMQQFVGEQRGDESNKDWYSFAGITITFKIGTGRAPKCPAFQNHYYYKEYRTN